MVIDTFLLFDFLSKVDVLKSWKIDVVMALILLPEQPGLTYIDTLDKGIWLHKVVDFFWMTFWNFWEQTKILKCLIVFLKAVSSIARPFPLVWTKSILLEYLPTISCIYRQHMCFISSYFKACVNRIIKALQSRRTCKLLVCPFIF